MVLLGLGILVASLSFLAYQHSPTAWSRLLHAWTRKGITADESAKGATAIEATYPDEDSDENFVSWDKRLQQHELQGYLEDQVNGPSEKGPKTKAIHEQGPIPSFTLDDSHVGRTAPAAVHNDQTSIQPPKSTPITPQTCQGTSSVSSNLMPPPVRPSTLSKPLRPIPKLSTNLRPPPSAASTLRAPPSRSLAPPSLSIPASSSTLSPSSRPSKKVLLSPGHSPLDWAHLTNNPPSSTYLRGASVPSHLVRVTPSQVRYHNGRKGRDAWGVWQGKVYNITPYLKFHPGGVGELMRGAGKITEGEKLFMEIHPWVSWEGMLGECLVGILVGENEGKVGGEGQGDLEEMD